VVVYTPREVSRSFSAHANGLADSPALHKSRSRTAAASSSPLFRCVQHHRPGFTCIGASRGCTFGPGLWSSPFTWSPLSSFPFPGQVLDLPVTLVVRCKHLRVPVVIPVCHCQLLDLFVALAVFCKHQQVPIVVMPIPVCPRWLLDPPVALVVRWKRPRIPVAVVAVLVISCHRPHSCPSKLAVSCTNHPRSFQAPASSSRCCSCSRISC
jgi:hypothetical protein